jgi:catechol 2,3-dioxygenase-like lactoylglutathione lyase family enzyme
MARPARLIGINHVALEVGDVDEALDFYRRVFAFELRGRVPGMAFVDMGDQFLALAEGRTQPRDDGRHFGLVVDDLRAVRASLADEGIEAIETGGGSGFDFYDPWGNRIEVVEYGEIQFERTPGVKRKLGIEGLTKSESARREIEDRGLE